MQKITATLTGIAPLMFHSERLANHRDPLVRDLKKLTALKGKSKTDEVLDQIMRLEWTGGMYLDEGAPALPSDCLIATLKFAARKSKRGKDVESSVFTEQAFFPLEYDGPKTLDEMWADGRFLDYRSVGVQGKRIMRARPIFRDWSVLIELVYDEEIINSDDIVEWLRVAGNQIGLCERRPRYGRFTVEV